VGTARCALTHPTDFVALLLAMTGRALSFSRREMSELFEQLSLLETEGAGKAGRRLAPMVRVQQKSTRQNHRFSRNHPAFPAQWFYGLYVISPVTPGFVVTVALRHLAKQGTCIGAPGPHAFAVRDLSFVV
jgi:hypothetical protein